MKSFVQGCVDTSFKRQYHIEPVIFKELALLPNCTNPLVYCGILDNAPIIL
jgi:hypothetical protein